MEGHVGWMEKGQENVGHRGPFQGGLGLILEVPPVGFGAGGSELPLPSHVQTTGCPCKQYVARTQPCLTAHVLSVVAMTKDHVACSIYYTASGPLWKKLAGLLSGP